MVAGRLPKGRLARSGRIGRLAAGQAVRGVGTRLSMIGKPEQARQLLAERSALQAAQQVVTVLGGMKGASMKLGQMLSVLDIDLVPESHRELFRTKLSELTDRAPTVPFDTMRAVIEQDLGPLARAFADFDETPVAAASIGQVYRARTHDGRDVAVKVKYPGVDEAVESDMRNLDLFSKLWKSMLPSAADAGVLDEISRNIAGELDYPREALAQHRVSERYRGHPYITVPDTVPELCSHHVLVSEFVAGHPFQRLQELPDAARDEFGELIYRFYISAMFADHEFCGDPHPGNILLAADGRLAFVDFGLYNRMDPAHLDFERMVLRAAGEFRPKDIYTTWVARGIVDPESAVTPEECLEYVWAAAGWHLLDEEITVTPEVATSAILLAVDPRAAEFRNMRHQLLPPEHVFSRRVDLWTFAALGQLGTTNNWHRLAREWLYDEPPATEIGRAVARWRADAVG
ncbi:AarF/ABC1/UbiB kinase family protein [Nocardia puris]|uniref:ABC1 kinase family protein n=1 Tax=Nocardia puris TaxID=208602 RepID=UPI001895D4A8|nr:AarF/ABC1/UbiB kinase family protein [Nocardia puris]MBF6214752.1 AarF/ABC1/UbiB kinase family protein [Nocardia puris]MBF6368774.1 AarF/ABC1/UbiB kinase family protein [Nocardia puris]MBF6462354.1 AarF/ABC1/UbiB kinase family protein [Nocardia puris]